MPIIRVYRTLPAVVHSVILVRLALRIIILELEHDVCEAINGVELFRSIPMNVFKVQVGADPSWGVRSSVGSRYWTRWE